MDADEIYAEDVDWKATAANLQLEVTRLETEVRRLSGGRDGELSAPRGLLKSFVDEEPCWFDHHGGCQAHGFLSLEPGEICPQQQLKTLLGGTEAGS